jgi:hypothetical protein
MIYHGGEVPLVKFAFLSSAAVTCSVKVFQRGEEKIKGDGGVFKK